MSDYDILKAMLEKVGAWSVYNSDTCICVGSGEGAEFHFDKDGNLIKIC